MPFRTRPIFLSVARVGRGRRSMSHDADRVHLLEQTIRSLLPLLPDSPEFVRCWNQLPGEAQDQVRRARELATIALGGDSASPTILEDAVRALSRALPDAKM